MKSDTLYISDLDGTLLNSDAQLSEYTISIINQLIEQGLQFTYATARSFTSASELTRPLNLKTPVITYNGTMIIDPQTSEIISMDKFTDLQKDYFRDIFDQLKIYPLVYTFIEGKERIIWQSGYVNEGMQFYLSAHRKDQRINPVADRKKLLTGNVFHFSCIGPKDYLQPLFDEVSQRTDINSVFYLDQYSREYWLEIMPENSTKSIAAKYVKAMTGTEKIVCFGDGLNDLPLFDLADLSCAVDNASDKVKKKADIFLESNDCDGVAKWLLKQMIRPSE